jgi:hypothetical protein
VPLLRHDPASVHDQDSLKQWGVTPPVRGFGYLTRETR